MFCGRSFLRVNPRIFWDWQAGSSTPECSAITGITACICYLYMFATFLSMTDLHTGVWLRWGSNLNCIQSGSNLKRINIIILILILQFLCHLEVLEIASMNICINLIYNQAKRIYGRNSFTLRLCRYALRSVSEFHMITWLVIHCKVYLKDKLFSQHKDAVY